MPDQKRRIEDKLPGHSLDWSDARDERTSADGAAIPDILFDGYAVYEEVLRRPDHAPRTGQVHVSDTLDAVVRLMRKAAPVAVEQTTCALTDEMALFEKHWPEIHSSGINKGWRGVALAAWKVRAAIATELASQSQELFNGALEIAVPPEVRRALDRMCTLLDESRLGGATAQEDARCMQIIKSFIDSLAGQSQATKVQAVPELHNAIMNIPCSYERACEEYSMSFDAYKAGHRDALHSAAELVSKSEAAQEVTQQAAPNYSDPTLACSSCGLTMGESRTLGHIKLGILTVSPAATQQAAKAEPVAEVDAGEEGLFVEILYGENGSPLKVGDKLYLSAPAAKAETAEQALSSPPFAAPAMIVGAPGVAENQDFNSFWYSHMQDEQMIGVLSTTSYSAAQYVWNAACRCRAQRTNKNDNGSVIAPTTSTVSAPDEIYNQALEDAANLCENWYVKGAQMDLTMREFAKRFRMMKRTVSTAGAQNAEAIRNQALADAAEVCDKLVQELGPVKRDEFAIHFKRKGRQECADAIRALQSGTASSKTGEA